MLELLRIEIDMRSGAVWLKSRNGETGHSLMIEAADDPVAIIEKNRVEYDPTALTRVLAIRGRVMNDPVVVKTLSDRAAAFEARKLESAERIMQTELTRIEEEASKKEALKSIIAEVLAEQVIK